MRGVRESIEPNNLIDKLKINIYCIRKNVKDFYSTIIHRQFYWTIGIGHFRKPTHFGVIPNFSSETKINIDQASMKITLVYALFRKFKVNAESPVESNKNHLSPKIEGKKWTRRTTLLVLPLRNR